jgi:hypothetical protein
LTLDKLIDDEPDLGLSLEQIKDATTLQIDKRLAGELSQSYARQVQANADNNERPSE